MQTSLSELANMILTVRSQSQDDILIEKLGTRHTKPENELIQKMHDLSLPLGAVCQPITERAGAKHSQQDRVMVQRAHDSCVDLGATCPEKAQHMDDNLYGSDAKIERHLRGKHSQKRHSGKEGGSGEKKPSSKSKSKTDEAFSTLPDNLGLLSSQISKPIVNKLSKLTSDELSKEMDAQLKTLETTNDFKKKQEANVKATLIERALKKQLKGLKKQLKNKADVTKSQSDAPNYTPATDPRRCKNCKQFLGDPGRDWCERYEFVADQDYFCDSWEAQRPDEIPGYRAKADLAWLTGEILVLRHMQGKHNQKRHGWKYGTTKDAKRAFKDSDKSEREVYKERARGKRDTAIRLSKEVGVIGTKRGRLHLVTPYNAEFVSDLKSNVVASKRTWDSERRRWLVDPSERKTAMAVMRDHFNVADQDKIGVEGVRKLHKDTKITRIKNNQKIIRANQEKFTNEISVLEDEIGSYSRQSRSRRKMDDLRRKALFEYALRDSRSRKIDEFKDIQIRGMSAAIREIGLSGGV